MKNPFKKNSVEKTAEIGENTPDINVSIGSETVSDDFDTVISSKGKKKSKKKLIIAASGAAVIAVVALRILNSGNKIETNPLSTVSVGHVEVGELSVETSMVGTVMPGDVYYVIPKVSGEISQIYVSTGDSVKAGDPICAIDNSKAVDAAKISLDSAELTLKTTSDSVSLAKTNLDRMSVLLATGDISQQAYESAKSGYDQASAAYEGAVLQKDAATIQYNTQLEFSTVTAPVDGVVDSTNMSINGLVSPSAQVCVISSLGDNKVRFNVTDRLLDSLHVGDAVVISKQGTEYNGSISSVSTMPNQATGLYQIEAEFKESANNIAKGSSVKVAFVSEHAEDTVVVDTDNIHYDGGKTYVYTLSYNENNEIVGATASSGKKSMISENNKAGTIHKVEVEIGISNSEKTEILSGIDAGSLIVRSWTSQLYEGAQVQVLPEE